MVTRRQFSLGAAALAFSGLSSSTLARSATSLATLSTSEAAGYGPLIPDPKALLDLPAGFSYEVISKLDDMMDDNLPVPDRADGMGCIPVDSDRVCLVRNHELAPKHLRKSAPQLQSFKSDKAYDSLIQYDDVALPGGTSNLIYNTKTQKLEKQFLSLTGTIRNCAGGITPWGTWLTCEESTAKASEHLKEDHGYIFEVPANATGLIDAKPLKAMGRFNHEAAAVDPKTGIVYLTEDKGDSLFYRFIPNEYGKLEKGGKLQALVIKGKPKFDSRNWADKVMQTSTWMDAEWVDLENPESPNDDLRIQGLNKGAALFARGEGIHWGDDELYFCCTNGGAKQLGQIMRYQPSPSEGKPDENASPGKIQLFFESDNPELYNFGDNLTVMPHGHLLVCEDQYTDVTRNHLRGVTPEGKVYPFAKIRLQTEPAGACFSPDGKTLFVNIYSPTKTLAIRGPWEKFAKNA